jgi:hypothetical protein
MRAGALCHAGRNLRRRHARVTNTGLPGRLAGAGMGSARRQPYGETPSGQAIPRWLCRCPAPGCAEEMYGAPSGKRVPRDVDRSFGRCSYDSGAEGTAPRVIDSEGVLTPLFDLTPIVTLTQMPFRQSCGGYEATVMTTGSARPRGQSGAQAAAAKQRLPSALAWPKETAAKPTPVSHVGPARRPGGCAVVLGDSGIECHTGARAAACATPLLEQRLAKTGTHAHSGHGHSERTSSATVRVARRSRHHH